MRIQIKVLVILVSVILITGALAIMASETVSKNIGERLINSYLETPVQVREYYISILALLSAVGMILSVIISRTITQPIVKLRLGTEEIMKGNLDYKVGIKAEDEIGQLSRTFEKMTADLKESRKKEEEYTKGLERVNEQLKLEITERKRAAEILKRYQYVVESAHDAIFFKDLESRYVVANSKTLEAFGLSREDVIGKNDYEIIHNREEAKKNIEDDQLVFRTGKPTETVKQMPSAGGKGFWFQTIKVPQFDDEGNVMGLVGIARDITERWRAEEEREQLIKELEAKNAELERFIYTASHDLRSPLVTIRGFAGMLRKDLEQNEIEKVKSNLKYIENAATKMDLLLKHTLEVSRIGRVANPSEDVPFDELVWEAMGQTAEEIKSRGVKVSVAEYFPIVHVDRMRMVEVLVNLIENSINYMGEQPLPKIDIGYRVDGDENVFFVQDNGIGIEPSQHDKVFEMFYQVDKEVGGIGSGLAIVNRIIDVHGGRVWIESEKGKGCTVCFTLSVTRMKEEE